jgi:hypothetical protein
MKYVLIRSYHLASGLVSRSGRVFTLCGRWAPQNAPESDTLPAGKTCESCYRNAEVRDQ